MSKQHFIVRCAVFIFVCAVGYGMATVWLTSVLSQQLAQISNLYIVPCVSIIFIVLGLFA